MSFIAAAIVGGVTAIGAVTGAVVSANATKSAANTQATAAQQALQLQQQQFAQQQQNEQPWLNAGQQALSQLGYGGGGGSASVASSSGGPLSAKFRGGGPMGAPTGGASSGTPGFQNNFSMADFQEDPAYNFDVQQGQQAIERSAAARGGLQNGGTLKAISNYGQQMASNEYQNAYNRFMQNKTTNFNQLASIAGLAQTANGQMGQAGQNYATNAGNIATSGANAQAGAQIAQGNVWGNTLSSLGNNAGNTWMNYSMMNKMYPGQQNPSLYESAEQPVNLDSPGFGNFGGTSPGSIQGPTMQNGDFLSNLAG